MNIHRLQHSRRLLTAAIAALVFVSCQSQPLKETAITRYTDDEIAHTKGIQIGACQAGLTLTESEYKLMNRLGVKWLRNGFSWHKVEVERGVWEFSYYDQLMNMAEAHGNQVIILLTYDVPWIYKEGEKRRNLTPEKLPAFLAYVEKIAKRYGDRVAGFEIWNEPNTHWFWKGTDKDFFTLTKETTALLKEVAPDVPVAVGSILYHPLFRGRSFLQKMIKQGVLKQADAVALHPYGLSVEKAARRVAGADKLIKEAGYSKEIWITEVGFTTGGKYLNKTDLEGQALKVVKSLTLLSAAGADVISWFRLLDGHMPENVPSKTSSEEFFGLAYPDYTLKPAGFSYSFIAKELDGTVYIPGGVRIDISPPALASKHLRAYRFDKADGTISLVIWSEKSKQEIGIEGYKGSVKSVNLINLKRTLHAPPYHLEIGDEPILITGQAQGNGSDIEIIVYPGHTQK